MIKPILISELKRGDYVLCTKPEHGTLAIFGVKFGPVIGRVRSSWIPGTKSPGEPYYPSAILIDVVMFINEEDRQSPTKTLAAQDPNIYYMGDNKLQMIAAIDQLDITLD